MGGDNDTNGGGLMALDPGDEGSGTFDMEPGTYEYDLAIPERVWIVDREAYDEIIPGGLLPIGWVRAMEIILIAKEAVPVVSSVI